MRKRRRKPRVYRLRLRTLSVLIAVPLLVRGLWTGASVLEQAGEHAALLSAVLLLPQDSAPLLKERFRAEIYDPEGTNRAEQKEKGEPLEEKPSQKEQSRSAQEAEVSGASNVEAAQPTEEAPRIPEEYAAPIIGEDFSGRESDVVLRHGHGLIRNETTHSLTDIQSILETPWKTTFVDNGEPQVLIVHTHATESFERYDSEYYDTRNTWRSTDNRSNMVAVGDAMAQVLEQNGVAVLHDTTQHDYPSYNGSYERSAETIRAYLEEYPSIRVVLDVHRDAMQRDDAIVKPVAVVNGRKAAQIMIISACDDGTMDVPEWRENLRFAAQFQNTLADLAPGLMRPVYFCYRKYNMDLTTGSLLLEFGSNANTLDEAVYSAELAGEALANLIRDNTSA